MLFYKIEQCQEIQTIGQQAPPLTTHIINIFCHILMQSRIFPIKECETWAVMPNKMYPLLCSVVLGRVALDGYLGRHPSHREGAALAADVHQSIDIRPEQGGVGHGQVGLIGRNLITLALELLYV